MKIVDVLTQNTQGVAFEFFPYRTDKGKEALARSTKALAAFQPLYMSMTYGAGGSSQERTLGAVAMMREHTNTVVMPHMTCIGAKRETITALLEEYQRLGIENIMALRGDMPADALGAPREGDFIYAQELVSFIKARGQFGIGAAVYPEGHIEMSSLAQDMEYTKAKITAGVDFAVTQMFFDNALYFDFISRARAAGITIPIMPGILPVTDIHKLRQFVATSRVRIPDALTKALEPYADNPADMEKAGIEFTIAQCRDLRRQGVGILHFFTLNKADGITKILAAL